MMLIELNCLLLLISEPGDPCVVDSDCSDAFDGSFCEDGTCSCRFGFEEEGDKCTLRSK